MPRRSKGNDALHTQLTKLSGDADEIRRKIVATKEGGAITGEQRLREYTDELYGDISSYDGKPTDYQLARIDALKRETDEVAAELRDVREERSGQGQRRVEVGEPGGDQGSGESAGR